MERPYTILSCAVSLDGHIDDASPERLRLSSAEDFDEVDALRAECDAIMVGAGTVRKDNPRLLVRSEERRRRRKAEGRTGDLLKAVLSESGKLDPAARFFTTGDAGKVVYTGSPAYPAAEQRFLRAPGVTVVDAGDPTELRAVLADLVRRGVRRLMVEGGTRVHTRFLTEGLADELRLAVAPFFVGDATAPRFTGPGVFADGPGSPLRLERVREVGGMAVLHYRAEREDR
ncbi:RibD family protein [Nocardiopsis composta]|uniref:5-amino-6-(5-phosphoribosylamino)uracil reductase n=1 Tax=Nocardiopsis composta TaxID=157465 RepID=A0A7W8VDH9_9ACTN|nr:dihydrofolate reductase family protein [Nocardiopsis composta]MBB5432070.1 5-amino-6-(5-phosphoribosylamino)uracil reductase [Nocardiopsis composta]